MATIELSREEALVLFEFVSRFTNAETLEVVHPAEQRVLWDLCAILEEQVAEVLDPNYDAKLAIARTNVAGGVCE